MKRRTLGRATIVAAGLVMAWASVAFADEAPPPKTDAPKDEAKTEAAKPADSADAKKAEAKTIVVEPAAPTPKPPAPYENLRFREDWRPLLATCPSLRCDPFDRIKALRLGRCAWVDFGGQVRFRYEHLENYNFGALGDAGDDGWLLTRIRAHADVHLDPALRAFVEGIWADQEEREAGPRPIDENHGDLINAFGEVHAPIGGGWSFGLRAGREEFLFGKQRVIGPLDWGNTRRAFDGAHGWLENACWRIDGWWSRLVVVEPDDLDDWYRDGVEVSGLYARWKGWQGGTIEPYAIFLHRDAATFLGTTAEEDRMTVGTLVAGPIGGSKRFDFDVEAAYQFGEFGDRQIHAGMVTAEVGWKPGWGCLDPRFAIGGDWASGDDGGSGDLNTYNQLYPTGHLWFGWADFIGRQNLIAGRITVVAKLFPKLTARADLHTFWRASTDDAVYNAAGAVLRAAGGSDERHVAEEADLQLRWAPTRHLDLEAGYCHLFAGEFIEDTGASDDIDFVYGSVTFTF